jgi:hypothetical protein
VALLRRLQRCRSSRLIVDVDRDPTRLTTT